MRIIDFKYNPSKKIYEHKISAGFVNKAFTLMFINLVIALSIVALSAIIKPFGAMLSNLNVAIASIVVYSGIMFFLSFVSLSSTAMTTLFFTSSFLLGFVLSPLFAISFNLSFIALAIATLIFGSSALIGYLTKSDLSNMGIFILTFSINLSFLIMLNLFFIRSSFLDLFLIVLGTLVSMVRISYIVNILKQLDQSLVENYGEERAERYAVMGAIILFNDFVSLTIRVLRVLIFLSEGRKRRS